MALFHLSQKDFSLKIRLNFLTLRISTKAVLNKLTALTKLSGARHQKNCQYNNKSHSNKFFH
jgi:hypothetical protein